MRLGDLLLAVSLSVAALSSAHADESELQWEWRVEPSTVEAGGEAELVFSATIPSGLILYASDFEAELGPRPAKIVFDKNDAVELRGPLAAVESQRRKDKVFGTDYTYFAGRAEFRQKVRVLKSDASVTGRIDAQTCQEKDGFCELIRQPFSIRLD